MANPQKENGYTSIANELLEALCKIRIPGEAYQVFNTILRKTYGYNKKEDQIALNQLCELTGLKKPTVCKALNKLTSMNLINRSGDNIANRYSINKDFESWKPLPKKVTLPKKVITVTQKGNASLPKKPHTKENTTKDNITKDISEHSSQEIVDVIDSFKEVNPSYGKWYGNKTQRAAISRLLRIHGPPRLKEVISILPKSNKIPYIPTITTPVQLEDKWAQLEAGLIKKRVELQQVSDKNKVAFT